MSSDHVLRRTCTRSRKARPPREEPDPMTPPTETRIDTGVAAHRQPKGPEKIEVIVVSDRRVAAVGLRYNGLTAVGTARCHPNDQPDRTLGESLALARALHALARRLFADAQAKIDHPPLFDHYAWAVAGNGISAALAEALSGQIAE